MTRSAGLSKNAALSGTDCSHCESFSLASLRSRIDLFSESDSAPRALHFSSSQGPVNDEMDDSLSLAASDAEELPGSVTHPALLPSSSSRNARPSALSPLNGLPGIVPALPHQGSEGIH